MTTLAIVLILIAASGHAFWNLLVKRAGGGTGFVWVYSTVSAVILSPLVLGLSVTRPWHFGRLETAFVLGSACIHVGYFVSLQQGYRRGDLSFIYPVARGCGALLSATAAMIVFGERPGGLALAGVLAVGAGILLFAGGTEGSSSRHNLFFGLLTGVLIAAYTLWDKHAVSTLGISPLVMEWGTTTGLSMLLLPAAVNDWGEVRREWAIHRRHALGIGILCPFSYILILTAMVFSPVSYVAPAREVSILIGAVMGARFLAEGNLRRRLASAAMIVLGVTALAMG